MNEMIAYIELHLISLHQDADRLQNIMDEFKGDLDSDEYRELEIADIINTGEIQATSHLLSVAKDIMEK